MAQIEPTLIEKLEKLSSQELAELERLVESLTAHGQRAVAGARLGEALAKLDAIELPALRDEEIDAEIRAARAERAARAA